MQMQKVPFRNILHRGGRVVAAHWITTKVHPQILSWQIPDGLRGLDVDFDNVRRTLLDSTHSACHRLDFWQAFDFELQVRHNPTLARPGGTRLFAFPADAYSIKDAHAAATAMSRTP